jgi:hypothetical protein
MNIDPRLEQYLQRLESVLRPMPLSDRADIVIEIKSHVLSALERDPSSNIDQILKSLGEPEVVANKYLLERGLKPTKPPVSPIVKWLVVGTLGCLGFFLLAGTLLIMKFSPIVAVDEQKGDVTILGGLIQVSGSPSAIAAGKVAALKMQPNRTSEDSIDVRNATSMTIKFQNADINIKTGPVGKLSWSCDDIAIDDSTIEPQLTNDSWVFDLSSLMASDCRILVPAGLHINVEGTNGVVTIIKPLAPVSVSLINGKVDFEPDPTAEYSYNLSNLNGDTGEFVSSKSANPYQVKINVLNGSIHKIDTHDKENK